MENTDRLIGGKWEMAIGATLIPASLLGDIVPNYEEGTREATVQSGVRRQPSGTAETAELTFTLYLPSMDYLKVLFADAYQQPTGDLQKTGAIVLGGNACKTQAPLPINIHQVCDETDDNDIYIPAGLVGMRFNPTLSTEDLLSVEATIQMQPTENGYIRLGTGDLSQPSKYDVTQQKTVPITPTSTD